MPSIRLRGVDKTFGRESPVHALKGVDLEIAQGQFIAIEGPSGSGKSTLLNLLAGLDVPTHGSVHVDDLEVPALSEAARSRLRSDTFGFIFQSFHLMPRRSALENVEVGLLYRALPRAQRRDMADSALISVGLAHRRNTAARKLSGGECQRVAIARAIAAGSPIIVADEPTGNLDSHNSSVVMDHLVKIVDQGSTVVVVTHDPEVAALAPHRIQVRDGFVSVSSVPAGVQRAIRTSPPASLPGRASRVRTRDLINEAARTLSSRPGRLTMLVSAVALALGLFVATLGLSQSAESQVSDRFDARRNRDVSVEVPLRFEGSAAPRADLPSDYAERVSRLAGVSTVGLVEQRGRVRVRPIPFPAATDLDLFGVSTHALAAMDAQVQWVTGRPQELRAGEVLVGANAGADALALGPLELDPAIEIVGVVHPVAGFVTQSRRLPALANAVIAAPETAAAMQNVESAKLYISTVAGAAPQVARQAPVALDATDPDRFEALAPPDPRSLRDEVQRDVRTTLVILSVLAALASVLGVANAMMLGVLERVGELGLRRAMGARPVHLFAQTSLEALLVGAAGGVVGLLGGLAAVLTVTIARGWVPVLDLRMVPIAVVGGLMVGLLGGSAASARASRVQPADALRQ